MLHSCLFPRAAACCLISTVSFFLKLKHDDTQHKSETIDAGLVEKKARGQLGEGTFLGTALPGASWGADEKWHDTPVTCDLTSALSPSDGRIGGGRALSLPLKSEFLGFYQMDQLAGCSEQLRPLEAVGFERAMSWRGSLGEVSPPLPHRWRGTSPPEKQQNGISFGDMQTRHDTRNLKFFQYLFSCCL